MKKKTIRFTKMAGASNDFLVVEAKKNENYPALARKMCDRTNGIGADGLLVLDRSTKADYRMRIINPDGSEAEMCGNGIRCLSAYIVLQKKPKKKILTIETVAGTILAEAHHESVKVKLSDPQDFTLENPLTVEEREVRIHFIDTGVPHTVIFVDQLENIDVRTIGGKIRYHERYAPKGTNVNFVEQKDEYFIDVRTYERGVENETKACGTGATASAIIAYLLSHPGIMDQEKVKMDVRTASGEILQITFDIKEGRVSNVWLKGSAKFIAQGEFFL